MASLLERLCTKSTFLVFATLVLLVAGIALWPNFQESAPRTVGNGLPKFESGLFAAIPPIPVIDPEMRALGEKLFMDRRLSRDETISCATCHQFNRGGVDSLPHSAGIDGQLGQTNAPSVFNAALNFRQFWDGRAASLEEQINGPLENPVEMGFNWPALVARLSALPEYRQQFSRVFRDGITPTNIRLAIANYERTLLTPNGPFDRFLKGDLGALSSEAREGFQLFQNYGCVACHQGRNVGGTMYEKLGVVKPYFDLARASPADLGRFNQTGNPEHRFEFKVPSLRNVALTAPYFHDGSIATLGEAIRLMGLHQLGVQFSASEIRKIQAFLESLTGELPEVAVQ